MSQSYTLVISTWITVASKILLMSIVQTQIFFIFEWCMNIELWCKVKKMILISFSNCCWTIIYIWTFYNINSPKKSTLYQLESQLQVKYLWSQFFRHRYFFTFEWCMNIDLWGKVVSSSCSIEMKAFLFSWSCICMKYFNYSWKKSVI